MSGALVMLVALAADALLGWPDPVFRRIGHPVTWLGRLITALEGSLNDPGRSRSSRLLLGGVTTALVVGAALAAALMLRALLPGGWPGLLLEGLLCWPLLAARSMYAHVAAVARPLAAGDLRGARVAVAMIVGRDPLRLDRAGVARAALESLAENSSDGIVAPVVWGALLGLPGIAAYKAINTLDSMIGHRNDRFEAFGKVAARLDDVANLIPARLTGLLLALASTRPRAALACMRREARAHRSPNAGWPEAALAAGLGVRLSGPRLYGTVIADEPWLNGTAPDPSPQDMTRALRLYLRAMGLMALALLALALV